MCFMLLIIIIIIRNNCVTNYNNYNNFAANDIN